MKAGFSVSRNSRSRIERDGSSKRLRRSRAPRRKPETCSFRYSPGPVREPRVDRILEHEDALRDATRRGDHHDDHDLGLQQQHLDVPHDRRLEWRRRDEREQVRDLRERIRGRLEGSVDLVPDGFEVEQQLARASIERLEQAVDVEPVAEIGRHAPGGGMRVRQEAELLELGQLVPHGRRRHLHPAAAREGLRTDGLPDREIVLDHVLEDHPLPRRELLRGFRHVPMVAVGSDRTRRICRRFRPEARP